MDYLSKNKKCSTPEGKHRYIKQWLYNSFGIDIDINFANKISVNSIEFDEKLESTVEIPILSPLIQKHKASSESGIKRLASSPINERDKKILKKIKISRQLNESDIKTTKSFIDKNIERHNNFPTENIENSEFEKIFDDSTISRSNISINDYIEPISSDDKSSQNNEINVEEISDTDATASDLIEEVSSQLMLTLPHQKKTTTFSQNISTPSSNSTNVTDQYLEMSTVDLNKVNIDQTYISQQKFEKHKKKKPKKGGLLDILLTTMGKQRSNFNLMRHKLNKKSINITEKPFILLQTVQHVSIINDNQIIKCILVEDSSSILKNLSKNESHFINVINVLDISCKINVNEKPLLKIYEPCKIIDADKLFLYVTNFISIPQSKHKSVEIVNQCKYEESLNVIQEFHCSCMDKKLFSNKCKNLKPNDVVYNTVQSILVYK